jgi:hypothetical protein
MTIGAQLISDNYGGAVQLISHDYVGAAQQPFHL